MKGRWIMNGKFMIDRSIAMEARGEGWGMQALWYFIEKSNYI